MAVYTEQKSSQKNVVTRIAGKQNFTLDICNPDLRTESRNTFKEFRLQDIDQTRTEQNNADEFQ